MALKRIGLGLALAALTIAPGWTQDPSEDGDAPEQGVARISMVNGNVSVRRGESSEVLAAVVNAPLVASDRLLTSENSRAEVQFDAVHMIRVAPGSEIRIGDLQYGRFPIQLAEGLTTFRMLRESGAQVELSTPSVLVRPSQAGEYRILVRPDGESEITVRSGEAEIFTPRGSERLRAGQTMQVRGDPSDPEFMISAAPPRDEWDRFNEIRDRDLERSVSSRYVSPDVYGTEELDQNGRWMYDQPYGYVWSPNVDPGWSPYSVGRWSWVDYYGWTWISGDPFGWAPYHYGRWYFGNAGWSWYPGAITSRYYWRPALVGFFGWGGGSSFGFGFSNIGWVPLAPHERFRPWYGRGGFNNTVINNVNVVNAYRNAGARNGVVGMRAGDFGRRGFNNTSVFRPRTADLQQVGQVQGRMPFAPTGESRRFADRSPDLRGAPRTNENMRFFSRQGSQTSPASSAGGRIDRGGNQGVRTFGGGQLSDQRPANQRPGDQRPGNQGGPGWQRFEQGQGRQAEAPRQDRNQGRFGQVNPGQFNQGPVNPAPASPAPANPGQNNSNGFGNGRSNSWRRFENNDQASPQRGNQGRFGQAAPSQFEPRAIQPSQPQFQPQQRFEQPQQRFEQPRGFDRAQPPRGFDQPRSFEQPRFERSQPQIFNAPPSFNAPQGRQESRPAEAPRSFSPQQPVRINPPIVRDRGASGGGGGEVHSFGNAHAAGGFERGGGGGGNGANRGGGNPGGGNGGGNRGGGESRGNHGGRNR